MPNILKRCFNGRFLTLTDYAGKYIYSPYLRIKSSLTALILVSMKF